MECMENEYLKVEISQHGAELSRIYDKKRQHEVIWSADPAYWNRHAPVLFPFVGKVTNGEYRYQKESYPMGQHGFARDMDFTLQDKGNDFITFVLQANEQTRKVYPFDFTLSVTHRLKENCVTVEWEVINESQTDPMYFSIGGHPAFNCPADKDALKTDYYIVFENRTDLQYVLIDPAAELVDQETKYTLSTENGFVRISEALFAHDALIFDNGQVQKASIYYPDKTPYVTLTCTGFPSFGLWSKPNANAPYVCLEPWIGRCDNKDFTGELPDKYDEKKLEAGSTFQTSYQITVQ